MADRQARTIETMANQPIRLAARWNAVRNRETVVHGFHRTVTGLMAFLLIGCGIPRDPEETLEQISGGQMRVGVTENRPWTYFENNRPAGIEVELIERFAEELNSQIHWMRGSESELLEALRQRELDVVIGGLTDSTPWSKELGLTEPYLTVRGKKHVMAVPPGENRWLLELDRFLQQQKQQRRHLHEAAENR